MVTWTLTKTAELSWTPLKGKLCCHLQGGEWKRLDNEELQHLFQQLCIIREIKKKKLMEGLVEKL